MQLEAAELENLETLRFYEVESQKIDHDIFYVNPFDIPDDYVFTEDICMTEQDCEDMFATVISMYKEDKVTIDKAAERFLQRARTVQSSALFQGLMEQAMAIEFEIHKMCGENQDLQAALGKELANANHSDHAGHDHPKEASNERNVEHHKGCSSEKGRACDCKKN